uniref:Uncharacterized protein n=1 Tax=Vitis vinifera TaxID=29760 RepID=F6GWE2_VITVI
MESTACLCAGPLVVVNSTILNAKEPEKHVFYLVTDELNFEAMNMWFPLNPQEK